MQFAAPTRLSRRRFSTEIHCTVAVALGTSATCSNFFVGQASSTGRGSFYVCRHVCITCASRSKPVVFVCESRPSFDAVVVKTQAILLRPNIYPRFRRCISFTTATRVSFSSTGRLFETEEKGQKRRKKKIGKKVVSKQRRRRKSLASKLDSLRRSCQRPAGGRVCQGPQFPSQNVVHAEEYIQPSYESCKAGCHHSLGPCLIARYSAFFAAMQHLIP